MKKLILALIILIALFFFGTYLFIPDKIKIEAIEFVRCAPDAAYRILTDKNRWRQWWPAGQTVTADSLNYEGSVYHLSKPLLNGLIVSTRHNDIVGEGVIRVLPIAKDSTAIEWKTMVASDGNLFRKIASYFAARTVRNDIQTILAHLKSYMDRPENIYGMRIEETQVKDHLLLVVTKNIINTPPSTEQVYKLIDTLKTYVQHQGANQISAPILNVQGSGNIFETMVAIPVDRPLPEHKGILFKRMFAGKILVGEIRGGPYSIQLAARQLENYVHDYDRQSPALPFESLVTDRLNERDTTKWVTRLYYPVM